MAIPIEHRPWSVEIEMAKTAPLPPRLTPVSEEKLARVIDALSELDVESPVLAQAVSDLGELSSGTIFEGIEPNPDGIFSVEGTDEFEATATIYVTLQYGGSRDGVTMSDAYPAYVRGRFNRDAVQIESIRVDTSSFYE